MLDQLLYGPGTVSTGRTGRSQAEEIQKRRYARTGPASSRDGTKEGSRATASAVRRACTPVHAVPSSDRSDFQFLSLQSQNGFGKIQITADHLYNWDEKDYILTTASSSKRGLALIGLWTWPCHPRQPEWLSGVHFSPCLAGADGAALAPALTYKADFGTLQDT